MVSTGGVEAVLFVMASSTNVISLKETIAKLEKRVHELESNGGESCQLLIPEQPRKCKEVTRLHEKRTHALGESSSTTVDAPIPTYDQLFRFPLNKNQRDPNMLYGKDFLAKYYASTVHAIHLSNLRTVRKWMKALNSKHCDLRHNQDGKDELESYIKENHDEILKLKFPSAVYLWEVKDIYAYCLRNKQGKRKNEKKKCILVSPMGGGSLHDGPIESKANAKELKHDGESMEEDEYDESLAIKEHEELYHPEIAFDFEKNGYDGVCEGVEEHANNTFSNEDDEALASQGSIMALLKDLPLVDNLKDKRFNESLISCNQEEFSARKSKRAPKWSEKMQENMKKKKSRGDLPKKCKNAFKSSTSIVSVGDRLDATFEHNNHVNAFNKDDEETILMKFLELPAVDVLYATLKTSFNIVKRNSDFVGNHHEHSVNGMRSTFVYYLIATKKVIVIRWGNNPLSVDDIDVVD